MTAIILDKNASIKKEQKLYKLIMHLLIKEFKNSKYLTNNSEKHNPIRKNILPIR